MFNMFIYQMLFDEVIYVVGVDLFLECIWLMGYDVLVKVLEIVGEMCNWLGSDFGENCGCGIVYGFLFGVVVVMVVEVINIVVGIKLDYVWVVVDVGKVIDFGNFENFVEGGMVFGLGYVINCEIIYVDGMVEQINYYVYDGMWMW